MAMQDTSRIHKLGRLDAIRGFAAVLVIITHLRVVNAFPDTLLSRIGVDGVIVFFLLSGFVIYYATIGNGRERGALTYLSRRFFRIFPIFIIALVLSYLALCAVAKQWVHFNTRDFALNLAMLQDMKSFRRGAVVDTFAGNSPLWSLSYEWWFYLSGYALSMTLDARPQLRKFIAAAVSACGIIVYTAWPNGPALYASYFAIWWAGVEMAAEFIRHRRVTFCGQGINLALLSALTAVWGLLVARELAHGTPLSPGREPLVELRAVAVAIAVILAAMLWQRFKFIGFRWTVAPFAVFAPISYAMYVTHYPLLMICFETHWFGSKMVSYPIFIVGLIVLSYVLERQLQPWITRSTRRGATRAIATG